ncbi:uncharacterized protein LOC133305505 [Gastrolobium bilobum]|uniref:uncharacterized protein LOC133305505 n=1 Tax=Gastrolobium bilobum TaxID=150636 RepID=UPI002AB17959|nr:uncharacterized protein LOC133305505 [Gastrolobium bilobum]
MDNLLDDLLVEIWSRVPCKVAVRCKSISKRFLSLISSPEFIHRSIIYHHHHHMNHDEHEKQWYLNFVSKRKLLILFLPNILNLSNPQNQNQNQLSLSFLGPTFDPELDDVLKEDILYTRIVGCSNGLLLCKKSLLESVYFVCNPVTRDWVQLPLPPPPPLSDNHRFNRVIEGFVCEPYYHVEGNTKRVTFNRHRFRVVLIPFFYGTQSEFLRGVTKSEFEVMVFSSETGQWITKLVSCQKGFSFTQATVSLPAVAHGGKLFFMGKMSLLVYDPFHSDEQCHTIDYPTDSSQINIPFTGHVGVCCGNIRISAIYSSYLPNDPLIVGVWELKQEDYCGWRLLHRTSFPRQELRDSVRDELGAFPAYGLDGFGVVVRAFHPHHGHVVFFQYAQRIFVCNLKTNQFNTVGYGIHGFQNLQVISLDLPWWPTPVPSID